MFFLYQIILSLLILISPLIVIIRVIKNKEDKKRFIEKFTFFSKKKNQKKLIWFHGASVGEIQSIIPIIEIYEKKNSVERILITSSTLSSSKIINKFKFKKTIHQFYPIDHIFFTKRFLDYWRPNLAIFIESEIWPSMFRQLKINKIPLILLNARLTKKTFTRWLKIKNFTQSVFNKISIAYPQNIETKYFLKKLKTNNVKYIGNLKFAENDYKKENLISNNLNVQFKSKKIWVASSTHADEEIFCARAHIELKKRIKNLITVIIPRHVHRVKEIIPELEKLGLSVAIHSSKNKNLSNIDIYIVNTFGETKKFHKMCGSVFLGGSIAQRGGQNPLEAARFGAKILHGPNVDNFKDVYKFLKSIRVSNKINTPKELSTLISFNKNRNIGDKIKKIGRIILKKTIKEIDNFIKNEFKKT